MIKNHVLSWFYHTETKSTYWYYKTVCQFKLLINLIIEARMPTIKQTRRETFHSVNMSVNRRFLTHWSTRYSHISVIVACSAQANYSKWSYKFYWPRRNKRIFVHISSLVLDSAKWQCSPQTIEYLQGISKNMRNFIKMMFFKI